MAGADRTGRRRPRVASPRNRQVRLLLSDEELVQLRELASKRGISVQRMLVEDALTKRADEGARSVVDVDQTISEMVGLRQQIEAIGKNLNRFVVIAEPRGGNDVAFAVDAVNATLPELRQAVREVRGVATKLGSAR
jgi:4-hydroxyphenylpyruvate dioxygenase-like putative hemolysin